MAESRIVCVTKSASGDHHHITEVGIGTDPSRAESSMTVSAVRQAIDNGDKFYSQGRGEKAYVEKYSCCGVDTIRTKADDTTKDNLDTKRACIWS